MERYQDEGVSKDVAMAMAFNFLVPTYRKMFRGRYLDYVKWFHNLKTDPIYKEVMATQRRFMDEDDMDFEEATAFEKRKFLLNRAFKPVEIP